ncbi:hypothetical protein [Euzebya sp.]|uniref:hypothetical protein n=1 Tax=Euzebya sp. TaxID=1971409 RepID=UPI003513D63D
MGHPPRGIARFRLGRDEGQSTIEWLGIAAVVVGIVVALALLAPTSGGRIGQALECLVVQVTGDGACEGGVARGAPERACTTSVASGEISGDVRVTFINAGAGKLVRIRHTSDGEIHVTFVDSGSLGVSAEAGAEGSVTVGDNEVGLGANASIGGSLDGEVGDTVSFDDPDDAREYIIDRVADEAIESLPPGVEQVAGIGKDLIGGILGHDAPDGTPESTHGAIDIGIDGEASATAGPASAGIEAAIGAGARVEQKADGSRTVRISASAEAAAALGIPVALDVGASGRTEVRLELDIAADGTPTTGRVVAITEGGVDDQILPDVDSFGDLVNQVTTDIPGGEGQRTVITGELDLTDPALAEAFGDVLAAAGDVDVDGVVEAGEEVVDAVADAGTLSVETYDITRNSLEAGAEVNLGIGLGASGGGTLETATLTEALYLDPLTGQLVPWEGCLGGS